MRHNLLSIQEILQQQSEMLKTIREFTNNLIHSPYYFICQIISVVFCIVLLSVSIGLSRKSYFVASKICAALGAVGLVTQAIHSFFLYLK